MTKSVTSRPAAKGSALALAAGLLVAGCVNTGTGPVEGIGFREARFQEIAAMREYRACIEDAVAQTDSARSRANAAGFIAAARLIESCESKLGPEAVELAPEERMRAYALSVMNYIRGGDIVKARANLETFKSTWPEHDLVLPDRSSFVDTAELLTSGIEATDPKKVAFYDVSRDLKGEVNRVKFWKRN